MKVIAKMKPQAKLKPQAKVAPSARGWVTATVTDSPRKSPTSTADLEARIAPLTPLPQASGGPPVRPAGGGAAPMPPSDGPPLKQVVESYFSDKNLKQDRFLRDLITSSPGGWVDMDAVLQLKRVRALKAKRDETLRTLRESRLLEVWRDSGDGSAAVRRSQGRPLPPFEGTAAPRSHIPLSGLEYDEDAAPPDEVEAPRPEVKEEERAAKRRRGFAAPGSRYVGQIKSFQRLLGMGFIACGPTLEAFGKDIAVDAAEMSAFSVGDFVSFLLAVDPEFGTPKGVQLEAGDPSDMDMLLEAPAAQAAPKANKARAPPAAKAPAARGPAARGPATRPAPGGIAGMRFVGTVLSFSEKTRTGKIECPETFAALGAHITVAADELAGFEVGDRVSFALRAAKAVELEAE